MTYGDYVTKIDLLAIGPTLIVGEVDDASEKDKSNGAGKTTIVESIIWCIFGRTIFKSRPGDNIVNWNTKSNCYVTIETTDGYTITRRRKMSGNDLIIHTPDGEDISSGKNIDAQERLQKTFGLDYNIFTSSVFFGQFGVSFLELSDSKRRATLEKILHINHLGVYAKVAEEKKGSAEKEFDKATTKLEQIETELHRIEAEIESNRDKESDFERRREQKIRIIKAEMEEVDQEHEESRTRHIKKIESLNTKLDELKLDIDLESIEKKWTIINKTESAISKRQQQVDTLERALSKLESEQDFNKRKIAESESKAGTTCPSCEQEVSEDQAKLLANPHKSKLDGLNNNISNHKKQINRLDKTIKGAASKLDALRPDISLDEAKRRSKEIENRKKDVNSDIEEAEKILKSLSDSRDKKIARIKERVGEVKKESNPYQEIITELNKRKTGITNEIKDLKTHASRFNILIKHLQYIRGAYHDKKKIRAFILSNLIPFFNQQIQFYLDEFGLNMKLEFNAYLQPKMDRWPYDLCSGGERKRIDLSVMLALYDLHTAIYGTLCNVLVFDEVDGKLDEDGIDSFVQIMLNHFTDRDGGPGSILVISHKDEMRDAFPSRITVKKKDDFSYIEEIRQ